ncbi:uncharacterized protein [Drosophila tropicalis]|uniref:uncharacterized protein n=1 Tax=Drosophila tropicalis TaxID=46794 RepID=UPI0035ABD0B7
MGKLLLCLSLALVVLASATVQAETMKTKSSEATASTSSTVATVTEAPVVEQSTESPIADMALIESITPTEKTPVAGSSSEELVKQLTTEEKSDPQPHTVADFIIHPLIAFKPRQNGPIEEGKQASSATPAPATTWLFGMNPAQGLGSSFSTLAGSVSGWFNDRLAAAGQQLPGLVDTPVRESSTTSSSTTTTTQRPDIVVRLQQRPQRRQPVNANFNGNANRNGNRNGNVNVNGNGNRRRQQQRPNRFNNRPNRLDSLEDDDEFYYDDDDEFYPNQHFDDDEEDDVDVNAQNDDDNDDEDQSSVEEKPVKKQRKQPLNQRRKFSSPQTVSNKRRNQQKPQNFALLEEDDENEDFDDAEDDDEDVDADSVEETNNAPNFFYGQSTRRSQNQPNFIQRGQQSIISQIRQFTRGQTPAELGATLRRTQSSNGGSSSGAHTKASRRPQQTTFLLNRNGQTVYVAPELLNYPYAYGAGSASPVSVKRQRPNVQSSFPQPPLTVPVRRGPGRPTQYITIPWSQLGLSPPDQQSIVSLAEGLQAQPLILNIPQSAITSSTSGSTSQKTQKKKQRPQLTAAAVPLLADASLMDIFQPPQIPPSRTGTTSNKQPILIAAKPVKANGGATAAATSTGLLPTRIRPGTIVEKAPAVAEAVPEKQPSPSEQPAAAPAEASSSSTTTEVLPAAGGAVEPQEQYIIVGNDDEPGLSRQAAVQPAFGDARYVSYGHFHPYFDYRPQNRRFALRKTGRQLNQDDDQDEDLE